MLDTRGKDEFRQLFRLLGTGSRVLVLRTFGKLPNDRTLADSFSGRLVTFRELSFSASIREWFRTRVVATHLFDPAELRRRIGKPEADLSDLAGDPVHLRADSPIALDLLYPEQYRITLPIDKFPTPAAGQHAIEQAGFSQVQTAKPPVALPEGKDVLVLVGRPRPEVREGVIKTITGLSPKSVVVPDPADPAVLFVSIPQSVYPEGLPQAERALSYIGFEDAAPPPLAFLAHVAAAGRDVAISALEKVEPRVSVAARTETEERPFGSLREGDAALPLSAVVRAKLIEPLVIPDDASVLIEADTPSTYWYVPVIYVLLAVFLLFNLFALREALPWRSASSTR
jgi:hypothetical protein